MAESWLEDQKAIEAREAGSAGGKVSVWVCGACGHVMRYSGPLAFDVMARCPMCQAIDWKIPEPARGTTGPEAMAAAGLPPPPNGPWACGRCGGAYTEEKAEALHYFCTCGNALTAIAFEGPPEAEPSTGAAPEPPVLAAKPAGARSDQTSDGTPPGTNGFRQRHSPGGAPDPTCENCAASSYIAGAHYCGEEQSKVCNERVSPMHTCELFTPRDLPPDEPPASGPQASSGALPLACPFCGNTELELMGDPRGMHSVGCVCGACGPACDTESDATEAWNVAGTREEGPPLPLPDDSWLVAYTMPSPNARNVIEPPDDQRGWFLLGTHLDAAEGVVSLWARKRDEENDR